MSKDWVVSPKQLRSVIAASSVGTLIEWYDFYIFGMLATIISKQFFPEDQGTSALLSTLAIFAAGFIVRPFGAIVFGRLGDLIGRKYTFLLTLVLMGGSTFLIGLVPGFKTIGWAAPISVLILRLVQGLALGGEYGGAATYVAEHSPDDRRGYWTSWIQTTATIGLFFAIGIILLVRNAQGVDQFSTEWGGWRWPFWISLLLVIVSIIIRMKMSESPLFAKLKSEGNLSKNPIKESFGHKGNLKMVLIALFGAVMGQGVVWYTGQFYAQSFLENVCKVDFVESRNIILVAILFATPFFIVFGSLSDRIGRKWIMLGGMFIAVLSYYPIYTHIKDLTQKRDISMWDKTKTEPAKVSFIADAKKANIIYLVQKQDTAYTDGSVFKYTKTDTLTLAGNWEHTLGKSKEEVTVVAKPADSAGTTYEGALKTALIKGQTSDGSDNVAVTYVSKSPKPEVKVEKTLDNSSYYTIIFLVFIQIIFVTMVYGPIAAFLVELFPTKIRYTSMSLPYHIGNGVFGGLVPFLGTLIVVYTQTAENPAGNPLAGLWYPMGIATICFIIGAIYLNNRYDTDVNN